MLVILGVAAALCVVVSGYLVYRDITRDGDDNGIAFRDALEDAAASRGLSEPIPVAKLTPFAWDSVAVAYPYVEETAREDVGEDWKELPTLDEPEVAVYFIRDGRLAGWLLMNHELDKTVGLDTHTCMRLDSPAPRHRAYLAARRAKLIFTTAGGTPARSTADCLRSLQ